MQTLEVAKRDDYLRKKVKKHATKCLLESEFNQRNYQFSQDQLYINYLILSMAQEVAKKILY